MPQKTIILVRHGQTDNSKPPPDRLGNGLTPRGVTQAELTGRRLAPLPVTAIRHSTARRAEETARAIASYFPQAPVEADSLLLECIPAYPQPFIDWYSHLSTEQQLSDDLDTPSGMAFWLNLWQTRVPWSVMQDEIAQAEAAFAKYFTPPGGRDECEIIVCHGNIIRYLMLRVLQAPPELWLNADIQNCGTCEIVIRDGGKMQLISFNDTGHLPQDMRIFF